MYFKHWKHLSACEDHMHIRLLQDYSMLDWCDSFNGSIVTVYRYVKLLIIGYNYVQDVDSKLGQLIYVLRRVMLKQNLRNNTK